MKQPEIRTLEEIEINNDKSLIFPNDNFPSRGETRNVSLNVRVPYAKIFLPKVTAVKYTLFRASETILAANTFLSKCRDKHPLSRRQTGLRAPKFLAMHSAKDHRAKLKWKM